MTDRMNSSNGGAAEAQRVPEEQAPAQVAMASEAGLLSRTADVITRIRARLLGARAATQAPAAGPLPDTDSFVETAMDPCCRVPEELEIHRRGVCPAVDVIHHADDDNTNFAGPTRLNLQNQTQSESTRELFTKPASQLTPTQLHLRQLTVNNSQRLMDIENAMSQLEETKSEIRENIMELMKEWESVCGELNERMDFRSDADSEKCDEDTESPASELAKLARKTEKMRNLIERFVVEPTNYDFLEDKDDLLSLLPVIREPYTVDRMLSEISQQNEI